MPPFPLPLQPEDQEPSVDLGSLVHALYDRASYDLRLNHQGEPAPPLSAEDTLWGDQLLHRQGLR
jgi:Protein of unknown function (DUF4058)